MPNTARPSPPSWPISPSSRARNVTNRSSSDDWRRSGVSVCGAAHDQRAIRVCFRASGVYCLYFQIFGAGRPARQLFLCGVKSALCLCFCLHGSSAPGLCRDPTMTVQDAGCHICELQNDVSFRLNQTERSPSVGRNRAPLAESTNIDIVIGVPAFSSVSKRALPVDKS
jgi:hypothetical protein